MNPYVAVISAGRPQNVERMQAMLRPHLAHWFVGAGDRVAYLSAGADYVEAEGGLVECRNLALDAAFAVDRPCAQVSDDLKRLGHTDDGRTVKPITAAYALDVMLAALHASHGAHLAGVAPTDNRLSYSPTRPVSARHFCVGDLLLVLPTHLRFDPALRLKEDYDYTCQHVREHGAVARVNGILASFAHYTNAGGAVAIRNAEREQEVIAYLKAKWPGWFRDNPKRVNEVLLRIPAAGISQGVLL